MADQTLVDDLKALGIERGDTVLVRGALGAMRKDIGDRANTLISSLLEAVGEEGTICGLSFGRTEVWMVTSKKSDPYDPATDRVTSGGLASAMVQHPGAMRSLHPTNSMVAIGANAHRILEGHDHNASCFAPMEPLIDRGGKMLLVGCTASSPGFSTVHYAQNVLGLSSQNYLSPVLGRYRKVNGVPVWWRKRDIPGCSHGFSRYYPLYRERDLLREGNVGGALSYLISAQLAFDVELEALRADPTSALCARDNCKICRLTWKWKRVELSRYLKGVRS